jgi:hypothetical protein
LLMVWQALVKCLFVFISSLLVFKCPHTQRSKRPKSGESGGCTSKTVCRHVLICTFFPRCRVGELILEIRPSIFDLIHPVWSQHIMEPLNKTTLSVSLSRTKERPI